ncbi:MAG TPA: phosphotransferase [Planctomycetota bacterium]
MGNVTEILTTDLDTLPVVQAWVGLEHGRRLPHRVEVLRRVKKSVVCRLAGVGPGRSDIIAKSCLRETGMVERQVYTHVLPQLPVSRLQFHGLVEVPGTDFCWLFLEDARGDAFAPDDPRHRELATRWLAGLHTGSVALAEVLALPDRGTGYYRGEMRAASRAMRENYDNPALSQQDRELLDEMLAQFDFLESRWDDVDDVCRVMPRSLVHNDFAERNVRIRDGQEVLVFDWEVAGWGLPAVDMAHVDVALYWSFVRDVWPALDLETLRRHVTLGKLLRGGIAASKWSAMSLATTWPETANLQSYGRRIRHDLKVLGWTRR